MHKNKTKKKLPDNNQNVEEITDIKYLNITIDTNYSGVEMYVLYNLARNSYTRTYFFIKA